MCGALECENPQSSSYRRVRDNFAEANARDNAEMEGSEPEVS